jgi:predicted ATP-grasp superfamily ATP-dependent carboligase
LKILVHEHITGGGCLGSSLPEQLLPDALLMLRALVTDLADAGGVQLVGLRDYRLASPALPGEWRVLHSQAQRDDAIDQLVRSSDATWPIAPETGGVLASLSERVLRAGRPLLGSRPEAVRTAASKLATAQRLQCAGVPAVPAFRREDLRTDGGGGWVVKPDDGCGCEDVRLFDALDAACRWIEAGSDPGRYVLQPYLPGEPLSLSALARDGEAWLLSVNRQRITLEDGAFAYHGSMVNALPDAGGSLQRLAQQVAAAIPGLWGYFGVDLILAETGPTVVEVNPRLTTSYAGLRGALDVNPAALVLRLANCSEFRMPTLPRGRSVAVDSVSVCEHDTQRSGRADV